MQVRQLVTVGLRLFALWLGVAAFQAFGLVAVFRRQAIAWGDSQWLGVLAVGVFIGAAAIVWAISGPLSRWLTSGMQQAESPRLNATDLVATGCVLMGLWWLKEAIIPLLGLWLRAVALAADAGKTAFDWLGAGGRIAALLDVLQIGLGIYFVTRPYKIASRLIHAATSSAEVINEA